MNLLHGIPLSIWYDWKNDGTDPAEREHNFGTVDHDLIPKPAYVAIRTLTRELSGCRLVRRLKLPREDDFLLLFVNSAKQHRLAAWTLAEPHRIETELPIRSSGRISGVNGQGEDYLPGIDRGRLQLDLDVSPRYLRLGAGSPQR